MKQQGNSAIKNWIASQLNGTSVTVVLVGSQTCASGWVKYEIDKSKELGHGLLRVDISKIPDFANETSEHRGRIPVGYPFYLWNNDDGYHNMRDWIERAAKAAGK